MSIADVYGLQQLISEPTRITPTSSTLIDLAYANCADKIACSGVRHTAISDHSMVFPYRKLALNGMSSGNSTITYRNFRKFDRKSFRNDISSQSWENVYAFSSPNEMWQVWKHTFLAIANKYAPLRTKRVRARTSPCITSGIKGSMHKRDIIKIIAIESNALNYWVLYKRQRNVTNTSILSKKLYRAHRERLGRQSVS